MRIPLPPVPLPASVVATAAEFADGTRTPAVPRDAATVILLDPASDDPAAGPLVYFLRRHVSMDFAAGMAVYPGGGVDPRDADDEVDASWAGPSPSVWARRLGTDVDTARALVCAAVRETFEESGVLLAGPTGDTVVADTTGTDWEADREALVSHESSMTAFLTRRGLVLRADLLGVWDAWLTPEFEPKRYRTWFFVAELPAGQRTRDVSTESLSVAWIPAREAATQAETGELALMPPTYLTSLEIGGYDTAADVLAAAVDRTAVMFTPSVEALGEGWTLSMPERLRGLAAGRSGGTWTTS